MGGTISLKGGANVSTPEAFVCIHLASKDDNMEKVPFCMATEAISKLLLKTAYRKKIIDMSESRLKALSLSAF